MGKLLSLVTGLVMIGLLFTGVIAFTTDLFTNYGVTVDPGFEQTYAAFNDTVSEMQDTSLVFKNTIENGSGSSGSTGTGALGFVDSFFNIGWNTIKTLTSTYQVAGQMIAASAVIPGVDANSGWFTTGLITAIVLAITITLFGVLMRRDL